jgi:hypothetical protein
MDQEHRSLIQTNLDTLIEVTTWNPDLENLIRSNSVLKLLADSIQVNPSK